MEIEELMIYKQYVELIFYTERILKKYPKSERFALVNQIKIHTYQGLVNIIMTYKEYDRKEKLRLLNKLDVELKILKLFIRISKTNRYISSKNYIAWSKKLANINNLMLGWMKSAKDYQKSI